MSRITPFFGPILCRESRCLGDTFQPYKKWWVTQKTFLRGLPLTTPHGPLTRLGQPPLVPSLILNQLIKNDLDLFLLDRAAAGAGVLALIYIRIVPLISLTGG